MERWREIERLNGMRMGRRQTRWKRRRVESTLHGKGKLGLWREW
jgi:hypothetical protein